MADKHDERKCNHEICNCRVPEGEDYCSPHCEATDSGEVMNINCDCGHPNCGG
jgi:hypothetical protein